MSECESKFGVGDTFRGRVTNSTAEIVKSMGDRHLLMWGDGTTGYWSSRELEDLQLIQKMEHIVLPGGNDCCNKPLPDIVDDTAMPEPEEDYSGYGWIKVKRFDPHARYDDIFDKYSALERHHGQETEFLIAKVRELAARPKAAPQPEGSTVPGYDAELLEIQLASVFRALSVAHAGLIATPVETKAPTLALAMAMDSIEALIRDVRGE